MFGLRPAVVAIQYGSTRGNGERVAFLEAEVKNLRSEMQTNFIDIGRFLFVSRVGNEDWEVKNQVPSFTTLFLDVVSILQLAYSNCTDQCTQLPRGLHCDVIQAAAVVDVRLEIDRGHHSIVTDTTWTPIICSVGRSVLHFWHQLGREREALGHKTFLRCGIRGSEVSEEVKLVVQTTNRESLLRKRSESSCLHSMANDERQ
jgi:hypothetical protein